MLGLILYATVQTSQLPGPGNCCKHRDVYSESTQVTSRYSYRDASIALAKDNKFHVRTKHIDIRYHFIREAVEDGSINMQYIPTNDNIADIFTKPLAKAKFERFVQMLGLGYA